MISPSARRLASEGFRSFLNNLQRYKLLSQADKQKLVAQINLEDASPEEVSRIKQKLDLPDHTPAPAKETQPAELDSLKFIKRELQRVKGSHRRQRLALRRDSLSGGPSKFFMGIDPTKELEPIEITSTLFSPESETQSLVSDVRLASRYEDVQRILEASRPVPQDLLTDNLLDVLSRAIEENLSNLERPVLTNELAEFRAPYAMKRAALRNLLVNRCTRNAFEESRVDRFLDSQEELYGQRLNVLEPLAAFRGDVRYSFSPMRRLQQKLEGVDALVEAASRGSSAHAPPPGDPAEVIASLPEFVRQTRYPFDNYFGFASEVPDEVTGSIRMGRPARGASPRYPNLQCVAHSLPRDPKYRAAVAHAIRVLERSRGWDQLSKQRAVSRLVDVYNAMARSATYSRVMEERVPTGEAKGRVVRTLTRQEVFNRGLRYIPSLFRNHWNRVKRKP